MNQPERSRARFSISVWGVVLAAVIGVLFGLSLFTFGYARGIAYFSDEPETCMNCHVMRDQFEAWRHSSHARVAVCNDCHTPHAYPDKYIVKGINGFNHSAAFTLGGFHEPIRITDFNARVLQGSCESCHTTVVSQMTLHAGDEGINCARCHADVGHRTRD